MSGFLLLRDAPVRFVACTRARRSRGARRRCDVLAELDVDPAAAAGQHAKAETSRRVLRVSDACPRARRDRDADFLPGSGCDGSFPLGTPNRANRDGELLAGRRHRLNFTAWASASGPEAAAQLRPEQTTRREPHGRSRPRSRGAPIAFCQDGFAQRRPQLFAPLAHSSGETGAGARARARPNDGQVAAGRGELVDLGRDHTWKATPGSTRRAYVLMSALSSGSMPRRTSTRTTARSAALR
jgi:hypothetical protein